MPPVLSSASQPNLPLDQVKTLLEVQEDKSAPKKLVVLAVVLKRLVVVAAVVVLRVMSEKIWAAVKVLAV